MSLLHEKVTLFLRRQKCVSPELWLPEFHITADKTNIAALFKQEKHSEESWQEILAEVPRGALEQTAPLQLMHTQGCLLWLHEDAVYRPELDPNEVSRVLQTWMA